MIACRRDMSSIGLTTLHSSEKMRFSRSHSTPSDIPKVPLDPPKKSRTGRSQARTSLHPSSCPAAATFAHKHSPLRETHVPPGLCALDTRVAAARIVTRPCTKAQRSQCGVEAGEAVPFAKTYHRAQPCPCLPGSACKPQRCNLLALSAFHPAASAVHRKSYGRVKKVSVSCPAS